MARRPLSVYSDSRLFNRARNTTNFIGDTSCVIEFDHEINHRINYLHYIILCELCFIFITKINLEIFCSINDKNFFGTDCNCCQASFDLLEKRFIPIKTSKELLESFGLKLAGCEYVLPT